MYKLMLIISLLILTIGAKAQEVEEYVVITFERERIIKKHSEIENFIWIIPGDSAYTKGFHLFPLYLADFSYTDLIKCSKKDTINPYLINEETSYDFSSDYEQQLEMLTKLILSNRKRVQTIEKEWNKEYKEVVNVYATPIKGFFHTCEIESFDLIDYKGTVYLPESNFSYNENYWDKPNAKNVKYADYSFLFFVNNSTGGDLDNIPYWRTPK